VPIGFAISDALDGPVGVPWCGRDNALDNNSSESFELWMAGSYRLGQGLLQGGARDRFARGLIFVFLPQNQFALDASLSRLAHSAGVAADPPTRSNLPPPRRC
jgi:hypothetical protein